MSSTAQSAERSLTVVSDVGELKERLDKYYAGMETLAEQCKASSSSASSVDAALLAAEPGSTPRSGCSENWPDGCNEI